MRLEDEKIGDIDSIGVRMPSVLKAKIKAAAKANRYSMNAEIVGRLEASFAAAKKGEYEEGLEYTKEEINRAFNILQVIIDKA